jgi:hypothetical protein
MWHFLLNKKKLIIFFIVNRYRNGTWVKLGKYLAILWTGIWFPAG